jgi:IclR family pca regulon transcriptional regulator
MTLTDVAAATQLSPTVTRRFLHTLIRLGYAGHDGRHFVLRPSILELGASYLGSINIAQVAQPHLQNLRDTAEPGGGESTVDNPEGDPAAEHAAVVDTGRSDYPNQINNVSRDGAGSPR